MLFQIKRTYLPAWILHKGVWLPASSRELSASAVLASAGQQLKLVSVERLTRLLKPPPHFRRHRPVGAWPLKSLAVPCASKSISQFSS